MSSYSESELILPALYLMNESPNGSISTSDLISGLREILKPSLEDLTILANRKDDKFSQKVRNLVSHKTLEKFKYENYTNGIHTLTEQGLRYLNEPGNQQYLKETYDLNVGDNSEIIESADLIADEEEEDIYDYESLSTQDTEEVDEYPNSSLNIERTQFSVYELKRKYERKKLILEPDFQRKSVWKNMQKSELVESVLMNIPLPYIYLSETKFGELVVIDGRQRLNALFEYIDDKFKLHRDLKILKSIASFKFSEIDPLFQSTIEDYQLTTQIIKPPTSNRIIINIFERVNRSGTLLNNQEIRNALYQGPVTKLLKNLSESEEFIKATNSSVKTERMRDQYMVLRFLAFYIWRSGHVTKSDKRLLEEKYDYRSNIEEFLSKYMEFMNTMKDSELALLSSAFKNAMTNTMNILGKDCFRLPNKKDLTKKRPINMALFESLGYLMSHEKVLTNENLVRTAYKDLLEDNDFMKSFLSIDSTVKMRFEKMDLILNKII